MRTFISWLKILALPSLSLIAMTIFVGMIHGIFIMLLWNYLFAGITPILGVILPDISWLQGWALSVLIGLLFKSHKK